MNIPEKSIERLLKYKRLLDKYKYIEKPYIFSHDLARVFNLKPVQVRRDLMLLGYKGNNRQGYNVNNLLGLIQKKIIPGQIKKCILIGIDNLGKAATEYFLEESSLLKIVAVFDSDPGKVNCTFKNLECHNLLKLPDVLIKENIEIAVLACDPDDTEIVVDILTKSNIKGILNLTSVDLHLPKGINLENFDIKTKLEMLAVTSKK